MIRRIFTVSLMMWFVPLTFAQNEVVDFDGNIYPLVQIGEQVWMAENLRVTHFRNGDAIASVLSPEQWSQSSTAAYSWYEQDEQYITQYGLLYNWYAVNDWRPICPAGFKVPQQEDWEALITFVDPQAAGNRNILGEQLKSRRQIESPLGGEFATHEHPRWNADEKRFGTDDWGFSALPGGAFSADGKYANLGGYGYFWSSTAQNTKQAIALVLLSSHRGMSTTAYPKNTGMSVRCVLGEATLPKLFALSMATVGEGSTTPAAGEHIYEENTEVQINATPAEGWEFEKWVIGSEEVYEPQHTLVINTDTNATAHFTEIEVPVVEYTLTMAKQGEGSTTPDVGEHIYEENTEVQINATPAEGWEFEKWVIGSEVLYENEHTLILNADTTAMAYFIETDVPVVGYTLTMAQQGEGIITPNVGQHTYEDGTEVQISATPADGWEFEKWVIGGDEIIEPQHSLLINTDITATAHFTEEENGVPSIDFNGTTLFVSPAEPGTALEWGGDGTTTHAQSETNGQANTQTILSVLEDNQGVTYAAQYCQNLDYAGYTDWYLPAKDELNAIYEARQELGGFPYNFYWSSTEYNHRFAWYHSFDLGFQDFEARKFNTMGVRCVRKD